MFDKLKKFFQEKPAKQQERQEPPKVAWIPAEENPWRVPILDVRAVTHAMVSTSESPICATNAISYGRDDGTGFTNDLPEVSRLVPAELSYHIDQVLAPGALFLPSTMEHKWALYYHGGRILFIRSWLRKVWVTAQVECDTQGIAKLKSMQGGFLTPTEDPEFTIRMADFLIRSHALGIPSPAPFPIEYASSPEKAAMWCMSVFGKLAAFATPHQLEAGIPEKPLRTHSLVHIAVARGDINEVDRLLKMGLPVDLLAADGLAPLHWSFAQANMETAEFLIQRGSPVDVRSAEGATPLMTVTQSGEISKIRFLLDAGADVNAEDSRGFNALHRAAELGKVEVVRLLLERGAKKNSVAQGHTALSFAERRGHTEIVKMLKGLQA
jgi:hypothetical protein